METTGGTEGWVELHFAIPGGCCRGLSVRPRPVPRHTICWLNKCEGS